MREYNRQPNFFLVGAPKCGTTALSVYLSEHPNVFMTVPKEPHYFSTDLPEYRLIHTREQYQRLFQKCLERHIIRGEASTSYLYSCEALPRIRENYPDAKVAAMLRNPIEMAHAWHAQCIVSGYEDVLDFEEAWALQGARREGKAVPARCPEGKLLLYEDWASYAGQVERLYATFPREQVHLVIFDDFKQDTKRVYDDLLSFLGLPGDDRRDFPRINENKRLRFVWLTRYLANPPRVVRWTADRIKDLLGINEIGVINAILRRLYKEEKRRPLRPAFRAKLQDAFRDDVARLSALLGRDLSMWLEG